MRHVLRPLSGFMLGVVARCWLATLRVRLELHPELERYGDRPWVLAFFHGTQWPLLAWRRRRPTLVMVSHSHDGAMQTRALELLGFLVVRGSSSRGGVRGLSAIIRRMRRGGVDAAFAVDGPRGPYGVVKPGAALAATRAGAVLVPMGSAMASGTTFDRAWDRFALAWPWSRVAVALGAPIVSDDPEQLAAGIREANRTAALALRQRGPKSGTIKRLDPSEAPSTQGFEAGLNAAGALTVQRPGSPRLNWLEEERVDHA